MLRRLALLLSLCCAIVLAPSAALAATPSATEPPGFLCGLVPVLFCPEETSTPTPTPTPTPVETPEPESPEAPKPIEPPQAAPVSPPSEESTQERSATEGGNSPPSSATRNGSTHAATSAPVTQPTASPSTASPTQEPQKESVEIIAPPDDDSEPGEELAQASNRPSPIPWLAAVATLCFGVAIVLYRRLVAQTAAAAVASKPHGKHSAR